ncbi:hypothetical protein KC349_g7387 [Hortaea werneckii]|nr:hypothetical protein KC349_g7387 [Hortaea werneckii]
MKKAPFWIRSAKDSAETSFLAFDISEGRKPLSFTEDPAASWLEKARDRLLRGDGKKGAQRAHGMPGAIDEDVATVLVLEHGSIVAILASRGNLCAFRSHGMEAREHDFLVGEVVQMNGSGAVAKKEGNAEANTIDEFLHQVVMGSQFCCFPSW